MVVGEGEEESRGGDDHGSGNDETLRGKNGRHGWRKEKWTPAEGVYFGYFF